MIETPVIDGHQHGEMRVVRKLLIIPYCLNGIWRWGFVKVRQEFVIWPDYDGDYWAWVDREFVEDSHESIMRSHSS